MRRRSSKEACSDIIQSAVVSFRIPLGSCQSFAKFPDVPTQYLCIGCPKYRLGCCPVAGVRSRHSHVHHHLYKLALTRACAYDDVITSRSTKLKIKTIPFPWNLSKPRSNQYRRTCTSLTMSPTPPDDGFSDAVQRRQDFCPFTFPLDCGNGLCCPPATECVGEGSCANIILPITGSAVPATSTGTFLTSASRTSRTTTSEVSFSYIHDLLNCLREGQVPNLELTDPSLEFQYIIIITIRDRSARVAASTTTASRRRGHRRNSGCDCPHTVSNIYLQ